MVPDAPQVAAALHPPFPVPCHCCFRRPLRVRGTPHDMTPQVRYHDIHHWYPECNYGQYTMLWDWLMGSLKPYPEDGSAKGSGKLAASDGLPAGGSAAENKEKTG